MNVNQCPYEKTILSTRFACTQAEHTQIGERVIVTCRSHNAWLNCNKVIELLQENSKFLFKQKDLTQPLAFGKKLKVLYGGLLGIQRAISTEKKEDQDIVDIHALINQAKAQFVTFYDLPFQDIIKSIASFQTKRK